MLKSNYIFPNGVHTVLVTPFNENDLTINFNDIENWISQQLNTDIAGLVLLGTTSESPTLTLEEKINIVKFVHRINNAREKQKFITVGVGGNDTMETLEFAKKCIGFCDALMVTVPHYNKPPQRGIVEHFKTICNHPDISNTPVICYNVPSRAGINAEPETIKKVYEECNNLVAIKEASGSIDQIIKLKTIVPKLKIFSGDDKLVLDVMIHGGVGVISVASNVIPDIMFELIQACLLNNYEDARNIFYMGNLPTLFDAIFCETNPIPIKFLMNELRIYQSDSMRKPLVRLDVTKREFVINSCRNVRALLTNYL